MPAFGQYTYPGNFPSPSGLAVDCAGSDSVGDTFLVCRDKSGELLAVADRFVFLWMTEIALGCSLSSIISVSGSVLTSGSEE